MHNSKSIAPSLRQYIGKSEGSRVLSMEWVNYHHLLYFWTVAREGSITKASKELLLAQPTISGQIRALEESLGNKLFAKSGRNLVLTDFGRLIYRYADEMFSLGREMMDVVKGRPAGRPMRLTIGVSDVLPKLVVHRILEPTLALPERVHLICHEDNPQRLLAELSLREVDLVLTDTPLGPNVRVRAYSHLLGSSEVAIYGAPKLAAKYRKNFPESLKGAPFLLPIETSTLRRSLDHWISSHELGVETVGEFQDNALLKVFGQAGAGLFAAPTIIDAELHRIYGVLPVGKVSGVEERFYAISVERKVKHPAVLAITTAAREELFAQETHITLAAAGD